MRKLRNTEAELKKSVAQKKNKNSKFENFEKITLTHFSPMLHFYTTLKTSGVQKYDIGLKWVDVGTGESRLARRNC